MANDLEQRARKILAYEYIRAGFPIIAMVIANGDGDRFDECAVRAITAALQAPLKSVAASHHLCAGVNGDRHAS